MEGQGWNYGSWFSGEPSPLTSVMRVTCSLGIFFHSPVGFTLPGQGVPLLSNERTRFRPSVVT